MWSREGRKVTTGQHDLVEEPGGGLVYVAGIPDLSQMWNFSDPFLQRLRTNGDTLPARVYRNALDSDFATKVLPQPGGGWAIGSFAERRSGQAYHVRYVDSTGTPVGPARRYAPSLNTFGTVMAPGPTPGSLLLAGSSSTGGTPPLTVHPLLIPLSPQGDSLGAAQYIVRNAQEQEQITSIYNNILRTSDGGYVFTAVLDSASYKLGALVKVDAQLTRQWTCLLRSRTPYSAAHRGIEVKTVREAADGTLVLVAAAYLPASANSRFDLVQVSRAGQVLRRLVVVSTCTEPTPYDLRLLPDSSAIVVGYCGRDAYLARIARVARPLAVPDRKPVALATAVYPNPVQEVVQVYYTGGTLVQPRLLLVNALGQQVELPLETVDSAPEGRHYQARRSNLPAGIYFFRFSDGKRLVHTGRLALN